MTSDRAERYTTQNRVWHHDVHM